MKWTGVKTFVMKEKLFKYLIEFPFKTRNTLVSIEKEIL